MTRFRIGATLLGLLFSCFMPFSRVVSLLLVAVAAVVCMAQNPEVIGELFASDASVQGGVTLTSRGAQVLGGSEVRAGSSTAVLRLTRGGAVRVCPRTAVSVTSSRDGRGLMLAMSTGSLETRYSLSATSDSILTPDFRITLTGPGRFHFAISSDARGNTCVRALPENTASVIVSELMGGGQYQVKANEEVVFRQGSMEQVDSIAPADCGCPAPPELMMAEAAPTAQRVEQPTPELPRPEQMPMTLPAEALAPVPAAPPTNLQPQRDLRSDVITSDDLAADAPAIPRIATHVPESLLGTGPPPPSPTPLRSGQVHIQVDAPFIFRAEEDVTPAPQPELIVPARADYLASSISLRLLPQVTVASIKAPPSPMPSVPAEPKRTEKKGFFRRIGAFFAALFGG